MSATHGPERAESPWLYVLLALLGTAGFFYVNLAAVIVDGLVGALGYSHAQAGEVISANIYGASAGGLIAVYVVRRWPWRHILLGLIGVQVVIEAASMIVHPYNTLLSLRALDGLVGGLSVGIALSLLARTRHPDRAFGALLVFQFVFGGLGSWWLPALVASHGTWVIFACTTAMNLAALLAVPLLRMDNTPATPRVLRHASTSRAPLVLVGCTLLALFLFQAANMGLFAFIFPLGENYALSLSFISSTIGWTTWIGTLGAVFVIWFGTRFGRAGPLLVAMIVTVIGIAGFFHSAQPWIFFGANASTSITWAFVVPYLFGIVAALDRSGWLATVAGFVSGLGLASGPLFAGWTVQPHHFEPLIGIALVAFAIAGAAMLAAAIPLDRLGADNNHEAV